MQNDITCHIVYNTNTGTSPTIVKYPPEKYR